MPATSSTSDHCMVLRTRSGRSRSGGGKNASLGEMVAKPRLGRRIGCRTAFATTADAYRRFISEGGLD